MSETKLGFVCWFGRRPRFPWGHGRLLPALVVLLERLSQRFLCRHPNVL